MARAVEISFLCGATVEALRGKDFSPSASLGRALRPVEMTVRGVRNAEYALPHGALIRQP